MSHRGKSLPMDKLNEAFARIGFKPGLMRDLFKAMSAEGRTDVLDTLKRFSTDQRQVAGWYALLQPYDAFKRGVLRAIALGKPIYRGETLQTLPKVHGAAPTSAKMRAAVNRFRKAGLVRKAETGPAAIVDDPLLAEFLRSQKQGFALGRM